MRNTSTDLGIGLSQTSPSLQWAVIPETNALDLNDLVGLVCQRGSHYGTVGRIVIYQGSELGLVFTDGSNGTFKGPSLKRLSEPSLEGYAVEPFYIGDLAQNRHLSSSSHNRRGLYESMKLVHRTHVGLMKLSGQIGEECASRCARTVQVFLRNQRANITGKVQ